MGTLAITFEKSSCIVAGTFNMYIIQPKWLVEREILPKGIAISTDVNLEEPGLRLSSPDLSHRWLISPTKLAVESDTPTEDCGAVIARVLEQLPWTPLSAIGSNAAFTADHNHWLQLTSAAVKQVPIGFETERTGINASLRRENQVFNLSVVTDATKARFAVNVHTNLRGKDSAFACTIARAFEDHLATSRKIFNELWGAQP